ncbi:hypothetical protein PoB_006139800 [Plakobranchus ocellatus]|uniref:Uncharacterized protein n=1 Tax=Plakobranchus ocellatus TaxID=259542 RepID=A0AAV4CSR5_9GAST|nr:hypothetical protein PoB_006139800 [Plakobranchus ocellatus]
MPQNHTQVHKLNIMRCNSDPRPLTQHHALHLKPSRPYTQYHALYLTPQNYTQDDTLNIMRCTSRLKITPKTTLSTSCAVPHASKSHQRSHTQQSALYLTPQNLTQDHTLNIMRCTSRFKITPKIKHSTSCAAPHASKSHPRPHSQHHALYLTPQNHTKDHTLNIMRCTTRFKITPKITH